MPAHSQDHVPLWSWLAPFAASLWLAALFIPGMSTSAWFWQIPAALLTGLAVFAAVHHAEVIALRLGEPFGSLVLAIAVTIIEVSLIISFLLATTPGSENVARDTVYSTVMIVLNGVVGLCLVAGGKRHYEQSFRLEGVSSALSILGTLAIFTLIFPNYTLSAEGPFYSARQLLFIAFVVLALYGVFIFVQTVRHRDYFGETDDNSSGSDNLHHRPSMRLTIISGGWLVLSLALVVLLAKGLSSPISQMIASAGLPTSFLGVIVALIVLLPESVASLRAAMANRLQSSLNLALGSAIATIGLTIPVVALVSLFMGIRLPLGIDPLSTVLLVTTLFIATLTLGTGRTTVLHGAVHLVIFAVFIFTAAVP
jgi:Ca2+:H+ antiporter